MAVLGRIFGTEAEREISDEELVEKMEKVCINSGGRFERKGSKVMCIKEKEVKGVKKIEVNFTEPAENFVIIGEDKFKVGEWVFPKFKIKGDDIIKEASIVDMKVRVELKKPINLKLRGTALDVDISKLSQSDKSWYNRCLSEKEKLHNKDFNWEML